MVKKEQVGHACRVNGGLVDHHHVFPSCSWITFIWPSLRHTAHLPRTPGSMASSNDSSPFSSWFSNFSRSPLRSKLLVSTTPSLPRSPVSFDTLSRRLGVFDLILLGIGACIGGGIFVLTGVIAADAGPGVTVSFALAGLVCIPNALCYAELSSRFPALVGGVYLYAYTAFNELVAFLVFCQLMVDNHIGAASLIRSLSSYLVNLLELIPALNGQIPVWIGPAGKTLLGGVFSINILAPILLIIFTVLLCQGARESAAVNAIMTMTKILIILVVICVGSFEINTSNWSPFAPNGSTAIVTGATVAYVAYVGFDAVANTAEESKHPKRDIPIGILVTLLVCAALYVGVCLVITGMVPYEDLIGDAPLAEAFTEKGLEFMAILINIGATAGLSTSVLVSLYAQARIYLGLGRDGLLPSVFAKIDPKHHIPVWAQIWCGLIAGILATFFDASHLSRILSVGILIAYSTVCGCAIILRIRSNDSYKHDGRTFTRSQEAITCMLGVALCGFVTGLFFRFSVHFAFIIVGLAIAIFIAIPMYTRQVYDHPTGFLCPGFPTVPLFGLLLNMFCFAQLYWEAWVRFIVLGLLSVLFYRFYGQYHACHDPNDTYSYVVVAADDNARP